MLKVYRMPNGRKYRFDDADAPEGAVLVEKKPEKKSASKKSNKAKATANKARKAATK